jgi:hypothetical protein
MIRIRGVDVRPFSREYWGLLVREMAIYMAWAIGLGIGTMGTILIIVKVLVALGLSHYLGSLSIR